MHILVVGKGGREHALARALKDSPSQPTVVAWPGSDGMADVAPKADVADAADLVPFMQRADIDLCVVGEESYLAAGLADEARAAGIPVWGPDQAAARMEASKEFAKQFMFRHNIPTGASVTVNTPEDLKAAVTSYPAVLKFDGLAAGKGVAVCLDEAAVDAYVQDVLVDRIFGEGEVLVEEFLDGKELSLICAVCDDRYQAFVPARDYKRLGDHDEGPNTGGMGVVASLDLVPGELLETICREIVEPTVAGLQKDDLPYRGFLYFGLMLTKDGPKIIEYNCRFGDPEAQAVLPMVSGDFAEYLLAGANGTFAPEHIAFDPGWCVCVVSASAGYPQNARSGDVITGLETVTDGRVYHAGTRKNEAGEFVTAGGRVLAVVCKGASREEAVKNAYRATAAVSFDGFQRRSDIGTMHFD